LASPGAPDAQPVDLIPEHGLGDLAVAQRNARSRRDPRRVHEQRETRRAEFDAEVIDPFLDGRAERLPDADLAARGIGRPQEAGCAEHADTESCERSRLAVDDVERRISLETNDRPRAWRQA